MPAMGNALSRRSGCSAPRSLTSFVDAPGGVNSLASSVHLPDRFEFRSAPGWTPLGALSVEEWPARYVEIGAWHSRRGERPSSRSTFGKGKGSSYDERLQWAHNGRKLTQCESHEAIRCLVNGRPLRSRSASRGRTFFRSIRFTTSNFLSGCRYLNSRLSRAAPPNRRRGRRRPAIAGVVFRSISVAETEGKSSLRLFGNLFGQAHSASR